MPKPGKPTPLGELDHHIIATVREPFIVLDSDLRVISVNDSFYRTFKVLPPETEGRLIFEVGNRQWDIPRLRKLLENILSANQHFEDFEVEHDFPEIGHRTMLLNARRLTREEGTKDLILMAIEDVTKRKRVEVEQRHLHEELEQQVGKCTGELRLTVTQLQEELSNRQKTEESLKESEGRLRRLTSQLLTVQEAERKRLARELHDDLGQSLASLKLQLRAIQRMVPLESSETRESLERSLNFINEIVEKIRRLARNLMPSILEDLGLTEALKHLFKAFCRNIQIKMDMDDAKGLFSQEGELNIYRILQESFSNIVKYAQASRVSLSIKRQDGGVTFQVEDNGRGFDHQKVINENITNRGLGLTAMEERARMLGGSLDIWSQEGQGTKITLVAPIQVK